MLKLVDDSYLLYEYERDEIFYAFQRMKNPYAEGAMAYKIYYSLILIQNRLNIMIHRITLHNEDKTTLGAREKAHFDKIFYLFYDITHAIVCGNRDENIFLIYKNTYKQYLCALKKYKAIKKTTEYFFVDYETIADLYLDKYKEEDIDFFKLRNVHNPYEKTQNEHKIYYRLILVENSIQAMIHFILKQIKNQKTCSICNKNILTGERLNRLLCKHASCLKDIVMKIDKNCHLCKKINTLSQKKRSIAILLSGLNEVKYTDKFTKKYTKKNLLQSKKLLIIMKEKTQNKRLLL